MSVLGLYFGWPAGAVWSNLLASAICAGGVWWRLRRQAILQHAEQLALAGRHHREQAEQMRRQHQEQVALAERHHREALDRADMHAATLGERRAAR